MGWLADELGAVRDLDVQLGRLDGWRDELLEKDAGALTDLARLLGQERDVAREDLLTSLDSRAMTVSSPNSPRWSASVPGREPVVR